jgi:Ca2+-binding EF-hand superfamily protein
MICPGSPEWRAEEVLKCYASNDKGLTKNDLVDYFVSFLTVQSQVDAQAQVKGSIEDMAREMTEEAFDQIDDGDGVLTLEEFKKYFLPGDFNEVVMAMAEIDAKDVLKAFEGVKGNINPKQFDEIMHKLMPNVAQSSRREAFHVFDTDANGSLDKSELGGGLTLLCDGDAGARVRFNMLSLLLDSFSSLYNTPTFYTLVVCHSHLYSTYQRLFSHRPKLRSSFLIMTT